MQNFLNTKRGRWVTWLTLVVMVLAGLGIWKYVDNLRNEEIIHAQVTAPATHHESAATLKQTPIHQFTDHELVHYRKQAYRQKLDQNPNGYLTIPSIGVKLPIYNRANNLTLSLGVGKDYYLDSQMGQGNFVLAGHNMERRGVLLSDLNRVKVGERITLQGPDGYQFNYHITQKHVVSPYVKFVDGQAVAGSAYYLPKAGEKPLVTVYTCADHGRTRLVVQGELDE
ncbi:class A sortase [Limosilactobacillus reuteri]|uniref:class A sortase n=1 Tax=Limosilactobacillus reuteri TaxID=1598 RepID=UPI001E62A8FE|nr:class A sortase [Limosilactobacillus reuteri]MCC4500302.1 class A sortase [Limosilactobacillus reuteri]MCC4500627.1 class A sortase [Limosilactobacillus reuteri]